MTKDSLSSLTIEYLETFSDLENAEETFASLSTFQNRLLVSEAHDRFQAAKENLCAAIGEKLSLAQYIQGIQGLAERSLNSRFSLQNSRGGAEKLQQS